MLALYKWPCVYLPSGLGMTGGNGLYHCFTARNQKLGDFYSGFVDIFDQLYLHLGAMQSAPCGSVCLVATGIMQSAPLWVSLSVPRCGHDAVGSSGVSLSLGHTSGRRLACHAATSDMLSAC